MTQDRNALCACGSGRKYKRCCAAHEQRQASAGSGRADAAALESAVAAHQRGDFTAAAAACRAVLTRAPRHIDALHLLGVTERALGRLPEALTFLARAVALAPGFAAAHGNLGMVLSELGRTTEAERSLRQALALDASLAEVWYNLGNLLRARGELEPALAAFTAALARRPLPEASENAGRVLHLLGRHAESATSFRQALTGRPERAELWQGLGDALLALGAAPAAAQAQEQALRLRPDYADAAIALGNALKQAGDLAAAGAAYERARALAPDSAETLNNLGNVLRDLGAMEAAFAMLRRALILRPDFAEAHLNIGTVHKLCGRPEYAIAAFEQALQLKPTLVEAHNNLGVALTERGRHAEALAHLAAAVQARPDFPEAYNNLGTVLKNEGRLDEALAAFEHALQLRPGYSAAHSNALFTLSFMDSVPPREIYARHREFNARHAVGLAHRLGPHTNARDPDRRLRIGYISPDLRAHACAFFLEPLLAAHHRERVAVHVYAEVAQPDAVTARLRHLADHWYSTVGEPDEAVARRIRADGIDVLVDLAGHTAMSRLLVLAHRPAPVQVSWLGYPATTGLDAMDYRLTDARAEPPGQHEDCYSETLHRLPHSLWCYQPFSDMPEVTPLPALTRGSVTFGSFNNYAKIGPRVIALWARLLAAVPDARLVMITVPAGDAQARLRERFAALGVAPERLVLHDRLERSAYLQLFAGVDLALDPFPCNGGTTTCDALWMGLPVLALRGDTFLSRASYSLLATVGLPELAVADADAFITTAVGLAADRAELADLRRSLRRRMQQSPLLDADGFAHDMEDAYRLFWQRWLASVDSSGAPVSAQPALA